MEKIKIFLAKCKRVWHTLKKPTMDEFKQVSKISSIGILLLGVVGFIISLIMGIFV